MNAIGVLVTRPSHQAMPLARLIEAAGGEPVLFPAMQIEPTAHSALATLVAPLDQFDLVVFVSANAVRLGLPYLRKLGGIETGATCAAVGPGTLAELKKAGVQDIICPEHGFNSEALLERLSVLRPAPKRALIVRGQGGRETLADALRARGTVVEYLECYRRVKPDLEFGDLVSRSGHSVQACVATSSSIVQNLFDLAGRQWHSWLCSVPFFVSQPRVAVAAFTQGVDVVYVAGNGDAALMEGLQTWFARMRTERVER